jgi:hypothetical protein
MFFVGSQGEWEWRMIRVPELPGAHAHTCLQAHDETGTADCFYIGLDDDGKEVAVLQHVILAPEDVVL